MAVLVAISIPIFTSQLERSKEATDLSNIRAAYAEAVADYLGAGATTSKSAKVSNIKQGTAGWVISDAKLYTRVDGKEKPVSLPSIKAGQSVTVKINSSGTVTVNK